MHHPQGLSGSLPEKKVCFPLFAFLPGCAWPQATDCPLCWAWHLGLLVLKCFGLRIPFVLLQVIEALKELLLMCVVLPLITVSEITTENVRPLNTQAHILSAIRAILHLHVTQSLKNSLGTCEKMSERANNISLLLITAALDKCSLDLRQGCSQAWGWDPVPVQSILEWCAVYMQTPGLRI